MRESRAGAAAFGVVKAFGDSGPSPARLNQTDREGATRSRLGGNPAKEQAEGYGLPRSGEGSRSTG